MNKNKINKKQLPVSENQLGTILEHMDSKLDLVLEGHQALDTKFSKKFDEVDEKLNDIEGKINIHTEMIASTATDVEIIKGDVEFIKNSLKKKVDIDEFAFLVKRVALLEKKVQRI